MIKIPAFTDLYKRAKELILRYVPVPLFLGIEANREVIKFALLRQDSSDSGALIDYAIIPLGTEKEGAKKDPMVVVKNILQEKKLYTATVAKIAVSGTGVDSKRLAIPSMPKDEMPQALRWEAKEHFLFDAESAMLDFEILQEKTAKDGTKSTEVIATLAQNQLIDEKLSLIKSSHIPPVVITSVGYSLYNLYKLTGDKTDKSPAALVDIGGSTTTILVLKENKVRFIRQLGYGGSDFTKAMMGALISSRGKVDLTEEAAETLKKEAGMPDDKTGELKNGISAQQIRSLLRPVMEKLASDIKMSLDYYASSFNEEAVTKIILTGGASKLKNLDSELFNRLSIPAQRLEPPPRLKIKLEPSRLSDFKDDFPLLAPAIGAALNNIDYVNLIPSAYKKHKIRKIGEFFMRLTFTVISLITATCYLFNSAREHTLRKQLTAKTPQQEKLREFQELHLKITKKNQIVNQTLANQVQLYYVFKAFSNLTPREIYLERIIISDCASTLVVGGVALERTDTAEIILTEFIKALEDSPFFSNVLLASSDDIDVSGNNALEFEIICRIRM